MPKYFCDYCNIYLTHNSLNARRTHNAGLKHKANVRTYYAQFLETASIHPIFGFKIPNFEQQLQTFQVFQQNKQIIQNQFGQNMNK